MLSESLWLLLTRPGAIANSHAALEAGATRMSPCCYSRGQCIILLTNLTQILTPVCLALQVGIAKSPGHGRIAKISQGERNGLTALGGLIARMMVGSRDHVMSRYKLHKIKEIEDMVADAVQIVSEYPAKRPDNS